MFQASAHPIWLRSAATLAALAAVWMCSTAAIHVLASHYMASANYEDWDRASRLEPGSPEIWYQLGRFHQLDFDHSDVPQAISDYQRAVRLNPHSPYYKLDLASALEMAGRNGEADRYFRAAQADYPISAEVSWKYGNFLLRQQRLPEAYAQIRRALSVDEKLIPLAVSRAWRSDPDVHLLLGQVLPDTAKADWGALEFLTGEHEGAAAVAVWRHLIEKKPEIEWTNVFALMDLLLAQDQFEEAQGVWRQAIARDEADASGYAEGSLIYDGGFEKEMSGGGFGWRQREVGGVEFSFDSTEKHSGNRSARLTFDGTKNISYEDLYQIVLVSPATRYRFRGYLRLDRISTDSGVRFEIIDPRDGRQLDVVTPNETGTQAWTLEETDFTTGPRTHLALVRVIRRPSGRLDNRIRGTVWMDDLSIVRENGRQ
jgi:tetratricopeptide (TPR) repeat protein